MTKTTPSFALLFLVRVLGWVASCAHPEVGDCKYKDDCKDQKRSSEPLNPMTNGLTGTPLEIERYCQPLQNGVAGNEGALQGRDFRLDAVFVLTRHGDRSALTDIPSHLNASLCSLADIVPSADDQIAISKFLNCTTAEKISQIFNIPTPFQAMAPRPRTDGRCENGKLTLVGALQLIRLGEFLRSKYAPLFDRPEYRSNPARLLNITSTQFERTFQSAIAFVYGLVLSQNGARNSPPIRIEASTTPFFQKKQSRRRREAKDEVSELVEKSRRFFRSAWMHAGSAFDAWMATFVCRRTPIPCSNDDSCVTMGEVDRIYEHVRAWSIMSQNGRADKTKTFAFFSTIKRSIEELTTRIFSPGDVPARFFHFSGHDITVSAVLGALGFHDEGRIPGYASRVVFELYYETAARDYVLRILYNGHVIGDKLSFCKRMLGDGTVGCSLVEFYEFVKGFDVSK